MSAVRLAITLLALLAFTLQSYVTQVHIHGTSWGTATTLDSGKVPQPSKLPPSNDPANCPICQVTLHAGLFVTPSTVAITLPTLAAFYVAVDKDATTVTHSASHNWKSRAPPRN